MTRRLFWSYVGLVAVVLLALVVPLDVIGARYERQLATSQAERVATGVALGASADVDERRVASLQAIATRYHTLVGGEIEVFGASGRIVAKVAIDRDNRDDEGGALVSAALGGATRSELTDLGDGPEVLAAAPIGASAVSAPEGAVLLELSARSTSARIRALHFALAAFSLLVLVLAGVAGVLMARSVARPLAALARGVERFSGNDLSARVGATKGPPEVRALAARFDEMAGRIEELISAQARFVADASHQLRSPLAALRLRLENLEASIPTAEAASLVAAGRELERLTRLVDGLLALSTADQGPLGPVGVDCSAVVSERVEAWDAYAAERQVTVAWSPGPSRWLAELVPGDLDQMLDNLLANAIQVAPPASTVSVRIDPTGRGGAEVHVVDAGPGMTPDERERAFDRFWRASRAGRGGSGLGLAIVRQLAARNHLAVDLRPASPTGLDAVIELPAARRVASTTGVH
ncbi:MAG TPA: HAMP domain-containing sensor histidine kinase [Acidimicrobiales bacterium]|nr:HAMP domain-containing sensor histidine kinase [Acidimicrobiales bacterium]